MAAAAKLSGGGKLNKQRPDLRMETQFTETYFDSPRFSFFKAGIVLYIRKEGPSATQVIHQNSDDAPAKTLTTLLPRQNGRINLNASDKAELGLSPRAAAPSRHMFSVDLTRSFYELKNKRSKILLTASVGEIRSAGPVFKNVSQPVLDMELVVGRGSALALFDIALTLAEKHGATLQPDSIARRGFSLASPSLKKGHAKAQKVELDPTMSVGDAFAAITQSTIGHLMSNQSAALRCDPNGIHQTRVAMRRLRAGLRAFKTILPYEGRKAFNGELRWFQQRTGPARDWHVFVDETLPRLKPGDVSPDEMVLLRRLAQKEGRMHSAEAAELLRSKRYTRLLLRFGRWVAGLYEVERPEALEEPVVPFARRALEKAHRDLLKELKQARPGVMEDMHKVRLCGKKTRYAAEFFAALFEGEQTQTYVQTIEDLQNRLGAANDASVARLLVAELEYGKLDVASIAGVQAWSSRRVSKSLSRARPTLQWLKTADLFWTLP